VRRVEEVVVRGDSLRGLVEPGQTLSLWHGYYECERPRHGDLVAFRHPGLDAPIVKRVVAVAGDTFTVGEGTAACGRLGVNDAPVRTAAGREYCLDAAAMALLGTYARDYRGVVPADAVLLLGSGERSSLDSGRVGLVSRGDLLGRAMTRSP
jgi:signal peptidase I